MTAARGEVGGKGLVGGDLALPPSCSDSREEEGDELWYQIKLNE
jgi:hypothetical protein